MRALLLQSVAHAHCAAAAERARAFLAARISIALLRHVALRRQLAPIPPQQQHPLFLSVLYITLRARNMRALVALANNHSLALNDVTKRAPSTLHTYDARRR